MDPITGVQSETRFVQPPSPSQTTGRSGELGRNEFLLLLVAQLRNQNPLKPQDGTEFVAQMAQLTMVDELIAIKNTLQAMARPAPSPPTTQPTRRPTPFGPTNPA